MVARRFLGGRIAIRLFCVGLAAGAALAVTDVQTGANGTSPGQPGGTATASAVGSDPSNVATATGGNGGNGNPSGAGGPAFATAGTTNYAETAPASVDATATGGSGGGSYSGSQAKSPGGHAAAQASANASQATGLTIHAKATGGFGSSSNNAPGGDGGNATVGAFGVLGSTGLLTINVEAFGGAGSDSREVLIPGGLPGSILLNPIIGSSLGDATISLVATGGKGGGIVFPAGFSSVRGSDGGSVLLHNAVDGSAVGTLSLRQTATGGAAGEGFHATAGFAGSASSTLDRTAGAGLQVLDLRTFATGGAGAFYGSPNVPVTTPGGPGSATSRARNDGGRAVAMATATGGLASPSAPGQGGAANSTAWARGGSVAGSGASASAVANGAPGPGNPGTGGGSGGAAAADATAESSGGGVATVSADAIGGPTATGFFSIGGAPATGGAATATAQGSADAGSDLTVSAFAAGGNGILSLHPASGSGGPATATATGTSGGFLGIAARAVAGASAVNPAAARADASGSAPEGGLYADAKTSRFRGLVGPIFSVQTIAVAAPAATSATSARAEMATSNATFDPQAPAESLAVANAAPTAAPVITALSGNATSASRFDPSIEARRLLLGSAGARAPLSPTGPLINSARLLVAVDLNMIAAADRKNLQLALLNPFLTGAGPQAVRLRVLREGLTVHDVTLTGAAAARAYFMDRVLDFGGMASGVTGDLEVEIRLDVTAAQPGAGFYATFFLGNAAAAPVQSMDQWRQTYFGPGATNSGSAADEANPSGDGLSNLLKFALGLNPLLAYPAGTGVTLDTATGSLRLTVQRNANASGLTLSVEGADDPGPAGIWSTQGLVLEQNTATLLQVRDGQPIEPGRRRMLRLRVTRM